MEVQTEQLSDNPTQEIEPQEPVQQAAAPAEQPKPEKSLSEKFAEKAADKAKNVAPPAEAPPADAPPAFQPKIKFKVMDKEHEIPEFLRGVMKDEESQGFIHSLFEKAYGLETVKERLQNVRSEYQQLQQSYGKVMSSVELGREAYARGDLDTVFSVFKIPEEKVLQWAVKKVQLSQMPPDQRQVHEAREAAERRNWELERQYQSQSQEHLQAQSEQLTSMLDIILERPDFSAIVQAYDARRKPNAPSFSDIAIQIGAMEYYSSGKVLSPMEVAQRAAEMVGGMPPAAPTPAPAAPAQVATPAPQKKPVIPNVGTGKVASPAKSPVKSLDDIRRLHQQYAAK